MAVRRRASLPAPPLRLAIPQSWCVGRVRTHVHPIKLLLRWLPLARLLPPFMTPGACNIHARAGPSNACCHLSSGTVQCGGATRAISGAQPARASARNKSSSLTNIVSDMCATSYFIKCRRTIPPAPMPPPHHAEASLEPSLFSTMWSEGGRWDTGAWEIGRDHSHIRQLERLL